jgi:regulator of CtrA degradation
MPDQAANFGHFAGTAFFRKTYDEAIALLVETKNYVTAAQRPSSKDDEIAVNLETTRVTARLTQIVAWLMAQRAVEAGELTAAQACEKKHRLGGQEICLNAQGEDSDKLPPALCDLLVRSRRLYQRVARLDDMLARDATREQPPQSPN